MLGSSGSGKSTFARRLGLKLGIDVIHLDSYFWQPNWVDTSPDEWDTTLKRLLGKDRWVMDGNYPSSLPLRLKFADTVVFLDFGRMVCLWRCVGRYRKFRGSNRPELSSGCNEKIDVDFLKWIWNYPRDVKPGVLELLGRHPEIRVILLHGDRDVRKYLAGVGEPS